MMFDRALVGLLLVFGATQPALAGDEPDPSTLYELSMEGSTQKLKVGDTGKLVLAIKTKNNSHISDETPLKVEISGDRLKPAKAKLSYADSVTRSAAGPRYPDPRFEVPFSGTAAGKGNLDVKLTFFVCTEKVCARQQKSLHLPVEVN